MSIVSRTTTKTYFETGDKPTQTQFENFIDSALFQEDSGTFGKAFLAANTTASAQDLVNIQNLTTGTVGTLILADNTTASAQNHLGGGTVGKQIFESVTTASAQNHLGGGTVGKQIFESVTTASTANILIPTGTVIQVVNTQTGAVATGSTTIPYDDTIPQNTEGDEYMTRSITPTNSNNNLRIDVTFQASNSVADGFSVALFQDSTVNALAAASTFTESNVANKQDIINFTHFMTAGTTSSTTFRIRAGSQTAGTLTFNGNSSSRRFGGVSSSSITITEIKN